MGLHVLDTIRKMNINRRLAALNYYSTEEFATQNITMMSNQFHDERKKMMADRIAAYKEQLRRQRLIAVGFSVALICIVTLILTHFL